MSDFKTTNITYKGLTDGKLTITLLDSNNKKWVIWKKAYQKEEDSEAYSALNNYRVGDTFGVSYTESDESFVNKEGKTIAFTKRTIYSILPVVAQPEQVTEKPKAATPQTAGRNFDEENVSKCHTLFLQAYIQSGKTISEAKLQVTEARRLAELVIYGTQKTEPVAPDIAETAQNMEEGFEDIPF